MAQTHFLSVPVSLGGLKVKSNGEIETSGSVTFPSTVLSCGASLQSWTLSFTESNLIKIAGAGVSHIEHSGTAVNFRVWLQLYCSDDLIALDESELVILISAYCA